MIPHHAPLRLLAALALAAAAMLAAAAAGESAPAQKTPSIAAPADRTSTTNVEATDTVDSRNAIRAELATAQKRLDAIEASSDAALGAPPETPRREIAERVALARQLTGILQQQQDALDRMDSARRERADAERALAAWQGFPTPPPYSLLVVDALRDDVDNADARIASATSRRTLFDRFGAEVGAKSKASQAAARLAAEGADRAAGTPAFTALAWARDLAVLRARADEATRELLEIAVRNAREEAEAAGALRDLAVRKLAAAGNAFTLTPEDLARVRTELDLRRGALDRALERALRASAAAVEARTAAETRLARGQESPAASGEDPAVRDARLTALNRETDEKREASITAAMRIDLLKEYALVIDGERTAWEARAAAVSMHDLVESRTLYEKVISSFATIRTWQEYVRQQLAATTARAQEQETKLRTTTGEEAAHAQQLLDTYRQREGDLRRVIDQIQPLERLLRHFRADFEGRREASLTERVRDRAAAAWLAVRRIWNFEVATVDDSYETADGRKLSVARSVTLGKTAGVVLIIVVGYLLCSFVTRRIERFVVKRGRVAPQAAALLRNWILFALTVVLVVFALLGASIPLTAFAFLGGALAIAAGFGLQTLLKNFVAGLMLLFERPMRLGDLVDVDGIRGRVSAIGIRASTILSADGIESMIPNSAFIEGKLTNWTYSNPRGRQTIRVGVAYGTPLRKAGETLLDVLTKHGLVLKDPAPQVYLDEYGDNAIYFALAYWVDMSPENDTRRIRSDLLHMIDRALAEADIRIPFPQRDVHLDAATPLKVEVVTKRPAGDAAL